jgi:hypothetical protein
MPEPWMVWLLALAGLVTSATLLAAVSVVHRYRWQIAVLTTLNERLREQLREADALDALAADSVAPVSLAADLDDVALRALGIAVPGDGDQS